MYFTDVLTDWCSTSRWIYHNICKYFLGKLPVSISPEIPLPSPPPWRKIQYLITFLYQHQVAFRIPQLAASGIKVSRLDLYGEVSLKLFLPVSSPEPTFLFVSIKKLMVAAVFIHSDWLNKTIEIIGQQPPFSFYSTRMGKKMAATKALLFGT